MPFTPGRPVADAKAELFKALGHPARIRVLEMLSRTDHTVGELAAGTGMELSHLSQHVGVLRRAGIVQSRRVGNTVVCTLGDPQIAELLAVARRMLTTHLQRTKKLLSELDDVSV